jgi:hypothetical protein
LGEFKKENIVTIFVKPHSKIKAFPSGVLKMQSSIKNLTGFKGEELDDSIEVMTSEVIDILSEYRCFIKKGELIGIKHYQGDFTVFPNVNTIRKIIAAYTSAPAAYSLDVAITSITDFKTYREKTILVEVQDMWSIGPYGLDPKLYVSLLKARWYELFRK